MERWAGKVAVVTGASSGIGLATAQALVKHGLIVIGLARRKDKMEADMKCIPGPGKFYAKQCDLTSEEQINETFDWIKRSFGTVNILINNAGSAKMGRFEDTPNEDLRFVINLNVMGVVYCSKLAIKMMKENDEDGHIININSVAGHGIPRLPEMKMNMYGASKFAITGLTETLRLELIGSKIRIASVSPGAVLTEIITTNAEAQNLLDKVPFLQAEDIANSIVHIISTPPHVNIAELTIRPLGEPF